jgi:pyruvate kinase
VIGLTTSIDVARIPVGARVLFDDGKFEGRITGVRESGLDVEITFAAGGTKKLRADRGVSFPGVDLNLPAMTGKDREDLGFAARHADMVALSFVRRGNDVRTLREALTRRGARKMPIVVKIENARAVEFLDEILLEALRHDSAAILVGRGDLAVECGFASLPLLQREILRRSHLAGLPVILATEVLENLSRRGVPTRSDMTDADFAGETECVLLNKGVYVAESVALLNRMYAEQGRRRNGTKSIRK